MNKNFVFKLAALLLFTFSTGNSCMAQQRVMLDSIIHLLGTESIYKDKFDKELYKRRRDSVNINDFKGAIAPLVQQMLTDIGDHHGMLMRDHHIFLSDRPDDAETDTVLLKFAYDEAFAFRSTLIANQYGYVSIPSPQIPMEAFSDHTKAVDFISGMAQQIQDTICALESHNLNGLILDLRLSMGGNMPLLLNSISVLIGDGKVFDVVWGNGTESTYQLIDGQLYEGDTYLGKTANRCSFNKQKIAVLIGPLNGSASSQTAMALKGLDNVRFFGEETSRYSSNITRLIRFSNGASLNFAAGLVKDREGIVYEGSVTPDVYIKGGDNFESLAEDAKVKAAIAWFEEGA
ncbi:S41 family peptidase [Sphingobacterium sp. lm-10]|uniref:S41 family peptidase n=1 Tax=Sphingobacterium sp. lm-10 TaxID=2944904 RepID=UPI0020223261|nr:S41 family peptidase [Sphingobacterium sp. lm-10]MCL7987233.1 S41 family peptidase [Sphingobacterium sp. lm-10]